MERVLLGLSMVTPSLLLLWYFHSRDVYPEPARVLWTTFGLGVLTAIPVLMVALPLAEYAGHLSHPLAIGAYEAFILAALPEETFKLAVLLGYARRHSAFDEPMDGLVYGVAASLGFATLENIIYVADGGFGVALLRALTSVPAHATFGAIMGYYVGLAHFNPLRGRRLLLTAWLLPLVLHGLYNTPLLTAGRASEAGMATLAQAGLLVVPLVLGVSIVLALRKSRDLRGLQVAEGPSPSSGAVAQVVAPPATGSSPLWWLAIVGGGGLASVGGVVLLSHLALLLPSVRAELVESGGFDLGIAVLGALLLGVLPLALGLPLFRLGTRRLNRGA